MKTQNEKLPLLNTNVVIDVDLQAQTKIKIQKCIDILESKIAAAQNKYVGSVFAMSLALLAILGIGIYCISVAKKIAHDRDDFLSNDDAVLQALKNNTDCRFDEHDINQFQISYYTNSKCAELKILEADSTFPKCIDVLISFCYSLINKFDNHFIDNSLGATFSLLGSGSLFFCMLLCAKIGPNHIYFTNKEKYLLSQMAIELGIIKPNEKIIQRNVTCDSYLGDKMSYWNTKKLLVNFNKNLFEVSKKEIVQILLNGSHEKHKNNKKISPFYLFSKADSDGHLRDYIFKYAGLDDQYVHRHERKN